MRRRNFLAAAAGAALGPAALAAFPAWAQAPAAKTVRLVVPFAPGGATDILARLVGQRLGERINQQVVIDNRPGAGTTIGNAVVAKSPPDGGTLLFAPTPFVISQALYPSLPYDAQKDFTPVALLALSPFILVVNAGVPARSVDELVALARSKPGTLSFCSAGNGTVPHLAGELFKTRARIDILHVPYKGGGPAIVDLVAGQTQMMFATPIEVIQHVQSGKLRVLGATSRRRLQALPDVPTIAESGYPDFEVFAFFGVLGPAGMAPEAVARLAEEFARVIELPDVAERLASQSAEPAFLGPAAFRDFLARERDKWAAIVKSSGAKVD